MESFHQSEVAKEVKKGIYFEINFQFNQFAKVVLRTIQFIMERSFSDSYR